MESDSLITRLIKSRRRVNLMYNDALTHAAKQCGLTRPEADVLLFLRNNPSLNTSRDIAYYRGFSKAYVSKAVEPLLRKGMIAMQPDECDRRRQLLTITGGTEHADFLCAAQLEFFEALVDGIPQSDIETFIEVNDAMYRNATSAFSETDETYKD